MRTTRTTFATNLFDRLRARVRRGILLEGLAVAALVFVGYMVVSYAFDRTLRLEVGFRLALLVLFVAVVARLVQLRTLRPLRLELNDDEMALAVERSDERLHQALISAVQFDRQLADSMRTAESRELMQHVVGEVDRGLCNVAVQRAIDAGRARRFGGVLAGCALLVGGWAVVSPATLKLWALRNLGLSSQPWPRATQLAFAGISGQSLRLPEGDDQTLVVSAAGVVPEQVRLYYRFDGGEDGSEPMSLTGEREFTYTLQSVLDDVVVWAEGGDGVADEVRIELVARPRIEELVITLAYPDYMQRPPTLVAGTEGDVRVPRGGKVQLAGRSSKPLRGAFALFGPDHRQELVVGDNGSDFSGAFEPLESGLLVIDVRDHDDLGAARPSRLFLRVTEDAVPELTLMLQGIGSMITPFALIPAELTVRDDYGLRAVDASFRTSVDVTVTDGAPSDDKVVKSEDSPFEPAQVNGLDAFVAGNVEFAAPVVFDLKRYCPDADPASENNRFRPGQFLSLKFSATDNFGPGEPHRGESEAFTFRVVTREKLMEDLSRRQLEYRRELEQIRDDEREQRTELAEILSPASSDANASRARLRVLALARLQRALGRRVNGVAERYSLILDEFQNNRLLDPGPVATLRGQITEPLQRLAKDDFPSSVAAVDEFAQTGREDVRAVVVSSYESIIQQIEAVLEHMSELETFATLLEDLRQIIKVQDSAIQDARQQRDSDAQGVFGTGKDKPPAPPERPRRNK